MVRKNRHRYATQANCKDFGVDLNRNYPYMWGYDNDGSSPSPCEEDYRGPYAGSEPETQAVINFVKNWSNLLFVISMHAYGNLFITPFNYDQALNQELEHKYQKAYRMYDTLYQYAPSGSRKGNGATTIDYTANGEASDYFLSQGFYSISPELGTNDKQSMTFFIKTKPVLINVLQQNYIWLRQTIDHMYP